MTRTIVSRLLALLCLVISPACRNENLPAETDASMAADAAGPGSDGGTLDAAAPILDAAGPTGLDAADPALDAASPTSLDAAASALDATAPSPDATPAATDAAVAVPDAGCASPSDPLNCCGVVCPSPGGATATCLNGKCGYSVEAANLPGFWQVDSKNAALLALTDDNRAVLSYDIAATDVLVDLSAHTTTVVQSCGGRRTTIAVETGGTRRYKIGGFSGFYVDTYDGSIIYSITGSTNGFGLWFAIDPAAMVGYMAETTGLTSWDLKTGNHATAGPGQSQQSLAFLANANTLYLSALDGHAVRMNTATKTVSWSTLIENWSGYSWGAVGPETAGNSDFAVLLLPGSTALQSRVALVRSDGTLAWKNSTAYIYGSLVWSASGQILVGTYKQDTTPGEVIAFAPADGATAWKTPVPSLGSVYDLIVGDKGIIYALVGLAAGGLEILGLDADTGAVLYRFTGLAGNRTGGYYAPEMVLQNGFIYLLNGDNPGVFYGIPVPSTDYDPGSSWPVRLHDNQRTSNAKAPLKP